MSASIPSLYRLLPIAGISLWLALELATPVRAQQEPPSVEVPVAPEAPAPVIPADESPGEGETVTEDPAPSPEAEPVDPSNEAAESFEIADPDTLNLRTGTEPTPQSTPAPSADNEPEVLVAEVLIQGTETETLAEQVYQVIETKAGEVTTRSQLQRDIEAIFATGLFADVQATPSDTPLGVRVTYDVTPNPTLQTVQAEGATVLPQAVIDESFGYQYGNVLNFGDLQVGVQEIEAWYTDNGYVLGKVVDVKSSLDGTVTLTVTEGVIEDIQVRGNDRTRDFIVTRELTAAPGAVFNRDQIQSDLSRVFNLNLFQDVNVSLDPGQDPEQVVVIVNVEERRTGSLGATAGVSSATGVFGGVNISEQNLGGNNQEASFNVQVGTSETLFDLNFTDPQIATMDIPTSYNANLANRQSSSFVLNEGFGFPNGDSVRINRLGGGITFSRTLSDTWRASLGTQLSFVDARDSDGNQQRFDILGNPITFSDSGQDSYTSLRVGVVNDTRNSEFTPSSGALFRASTEQAVGILESGLTQNRLQASYSQFIPVDLLNTREGSPEVLAFDLRAGTVMGELAPYDAFPIGGVNSVRGFFEGAVGSGRSFAQATAEYRFPIFNPVGGVLFVDYGTDLGSGESVIGNPAGARLKPGSALGLGAGLRIQSPLGPLRIDYGIGQGDGGESQLQFAIGEKF